MLKKDTFIAILKITIDVYNYINGAIVAEVDKISAEHAAYNVSAMIV